MGKINVLVTAAGSVNGVNIIKALRESVFDVKITAADCDPMSAGLYLADEKLIFPPVTNEREYLKRLLVECGIREIEIVFPAHSVELLFYAKHRETLFNGGLKFMVSSPHVLEICNSKTKTAKFAETLYIRVPKFYEYKKAMHLAAQHHPLFVKLDTGSGSKRAARIIDLEDLRYHFNKSPGLVVCDYIPGIEYTVNIYSNAKGKVQGVVPIRRDKVYGGLAVIGTAVNDTRMIAQATKIAEALPIIGPSNIQFMVTDDHDLFLIEINPRFACGGFPLTVASGMNIPELIIASFQERECFQKAKPVIYYGKQMIRYWDTIIV